MLDKIFEIDLFNVFSDDNYYYFFRALNMADNNDIETGITLDFNGSIARIRTNLERYENTPIYTSDDEISLEQVFDHIKMHQRKDTNCISLTSNANTAITYGRGNYKDKYVMIKVPKSNINISTFEAGLYMLKEVNNRINEMITSGQLSEKQVNIIRYIDGIRSKQELDILKNRLIQQDDEERLFYNNGFERLTTSVNYLSLNDRQNFEKDKIVLKLDIINRNLLKGVSNSLLIQTIGNAFSSLEMIHYGEITEDKIIEMPKELMDILGLIQQLPNTLPNIQKFKNDFLSRIQNIRLNGGYDYRNFVLDENVFSLDNIYTLTNGKVSYGVACELYKKAYYYAKSKIRMNNSLYLLKQIIGDNTEYKEIFDYIENYTYGIEPEITTRISSNKIQVSESVSLDFSLSEKRFFDYLATLNLGQLNYVMNNPNETLKIILNNFIEEEMDVTLQTKEKWYANSIIDMLDLTRLGVKSTLSFTQRNDLINSLVDNNFYERYIYLKEKGYKGSEISSLIFNSLIRNTSDENLNNLFSLEELEYFIGYNRVKGTGLNLRQYQKHAVKEINKTFKTRRFTSAILPTGAGKSFVALAEMCQNRNEKMLYLAPNVEILNQVKRYIRKIYRPEEHIGDNEYDPIKRMFPNVIFDTYQHLKEESAKEIINDKYSLIVFDELHRTGAKEWQKQVKELLDNQDEQVKVLGITATPERDVDLKDMTDYWARYYGYTDEEIIKGEHLAINMDLMGAIKLGYVVNPKVLNCEYSLITGSDFEQLRVSIDDIQDENIKGEKLRKYEYLRRNVEKSDGIEKILADNLTSNGKYIVFLPVTKKDDGTFEDQDGNIVGRETAEKMIISYKTLMKQYLFCEEYFNEKGKFVLQIYEKINNNILLLNEEITFLQNERENILLLSQINIRNKPSSLNTKNNLIIEKIIQYCRWEKFSEKELTKKINGKMRDKVEDYSMLGSYSDKKNKANLDSFNSNTSSKIKFMFVMNKLNEGVHVDDIDGIVWLRPLDTNSKILYLQQLGRCIYSINPNIELDDNKRPLVLDLVNNTLKVKLDKGVLQEEVDLNKLFLIESWIIENQYYPNYETSNKIERAFAISLNSINKKYNKYFIDETLLDEKSIERKILIKEILSVGAEIDLWSQPIIEYENDNSKAKGSDDNDLLEFLELSSNIRDFIELDKEVNEIDNKWLSKYNYAKKYYEQFGTIEVPAHTYIIEENENIIVINNSDPRYDTAFPLSDWLNTQRQAKVGNSSSIMTPAREKLLNDLNFNWDIRDYDSQWDEMFNLLNNYYLKYGNCDVKKSYRSFDGINEISKNDARYDSAPRLGLWVNTQRQQKKGNRRLEMSREKQEKLESIGFKWDAKIDYDSKWMERYNLLLNYQKKYGNVNIPVNFKTKDGINESNDSDAINLYSWVHQQKQNYKNNSKSDDELAKGAVRLTSERIALLENIGIDLSTKKREKYKKAKQSFDETSEFSKAMNARKEVKNETGIYRIS